MQWSGAAADIVVTAFGNVSRVDAHFINVPVMYLPIAIRRVSLNCTSSTGDDTKRKKQDKQFFFKLQYGMSQVNILS